MILQNSLILFSYGSGVNSRSLRCTMRLGIQVFGEISKDIEYLLSEVYPDSRLVFDLYGFSMEDADAEWMADYLFATDKTIRYDGIEFPVANSDGNRSIEFLPIRNSNARVTCSIKLLETDPTAHGRNVRVTVDDETRVTIDADTRVTAGGS